MPSSFAPTENVIIGFRFQSLTRRILIPNFAKDANIAELEREITRLQRAIKEKQE